MGIELESFRTAIKENGQYLTVKDDNMTQVGASEAVDLAPVKDPDGLNEAAKNIYVRGQLLEDIRSSLLSSQLMSVGRDPANGNNEVLLFQNKSVQTFFENAEKTLFGEIAQKGENKGRFGVETASQKLESQTAAGLIEQLDRLLPQNNVNNINNINNINNMRKIHRL